MKILLLLILISCGVDDLNADSPKLYESKQSSKELSINGPYLDVNGKCLPGYFGHRLGGDVKELKDNEIDSLRAVMHLQFHKCFNYWEYDITSAKNKLIVFHDTKIGQLYTHKINSKLIKHHTPYEVYKEFKEMSPDAKIKVDLKYIKEEHLKLLFSHLKKMKEDLNVKEILMSKKRFDRYDRYKNLVVELEKMGFWVRYY